MYRLTERWLVVALLFVTATYAVAEDITLTTYYPSPRGVYQEVRWGTNAGASLNADQGAAIELRGTGTPYLDFSNDAVTDFDMRLILAGDDTLNVDGGNLAVTGGNLSASGTVSAPTVTGNTNLCIGTDCRTAWPVVNVGPFSSVFYKTYSGNGAANFTKLNWTECWYFQNDPLVGTGIEIKAGNGSCHHERFNHGSKDKHMVFAACAIGAKVVSGGGVEFTDAVNDLPGNLDSSTPITWQEYDEWSHIVGGTKFGVGAGVNNQTEGWMITVSDTGGYDGLHVHVLCAE